MPKEKENSPLGPQEPVVAATSEREPKVSDPHSALPPNTVRQEGGAFAEAQGAAVIPKVTPRTSVVETEDGITSVDFLEYEDWKKVNRQEESPGSLRGFKNYLEGQYFLAGDDSVETRQQLTAATIAKAVELGHVSREDLGDDPTDEDVQAAFESVLSNPVTEQPTRDLKTLDMLMESETLKNGVLPEDTREMIRKLRATIQVGADPDAIQAVEEAVLGGLEQEGLDMETLTQTAQRGAVADGLTPVVAKVVEGDRLEIFGDPKRLNGLSRKELKEVVEANPTFADPQLLPKLYEMTRVDEETGVSKLDHVQRADQLTAVAARLREDPDLQKAFARDLAATKLRRSGGGVGFGTSIGGGASAFFQGAATLVGSAVEQVVEQGTQGDSFKEVLDRRTQDAAHDPLVNKDHFIDALKRDPALKAQYSDEEIETLGGDILLTQRVQTQGYDKDKLGTAVSFNSVGEAVIPSALKFNEKRFEEALAKSGAPPGVVERARERRKRDLDDGAAGMAQLLLSTPEAPRGFEEFLLSAPSDKPLGEVVSEWVTKHDTLIGSEPGVSQLVWRGALVVNDTAAGLVGIAGSLSGNETLKDGAAALAQTSQLFGEAMGQQTELQSLTGDTYLSSEWHKFNTAAVQLVGDAFIARGAGRVGGAAKKLFTKGGRKAVTPLLSEEAAAATKAAVSAGGAGALKAGEVAAKSVSKNVLKSIPKGAKLASGEGALYTQMYTSQWGRRYGEAVATLREKNKQFYSEENIQPGDRPLSEEQIRTIAAESAHRSALFNVGTTATIGRLLGHGAESLALRPGMSSATVRGIYEDIRKGLQQLPDDLATPAMKQAAKGSFTRFEVELAKGIWRKSAEGLRGKLGAGGSEALEESIQSAGEVMEADRVSGDTTGFLEKAESQWESIWLGGALGAGAEVVTSGAPKISKGIGAALFGPDPVSIMQERARATAGMVESLEGAGLTEAAKVVKDLGDQALFSNRRDAFTQAAAQFRRERDSAEAQTDSGAGGQAESQVPQNPAQREAEAAQQEADAAQDEANAAQQEFERLRGDGRKTAFPSAEAERADVRAQGERRAQNRKIEAGLTPEGREAVLKQQQEQLDAARQRAKAAQQKADEAKQRAEDIQRRAAARPEEAAKTPVSPEEAAAFARAQAAAESRARKEGRQGQERPLGLPVPPDLQPTGPLVGAAKQIVSEGLVSPEEEFNLDMVAALLERTGAFDANRPAAEVVFEAYSELLGEESTNRHVNTPEEDLPAGLRLEETRAQLWRERGSSDKEAILQAKDVRENRKTLQEERARAVAAVRERLTKSTPNPAPRTEEAAVPETPEVRRPTISPVAERSFEDAVLAVGDIEERLAKLDRTIRSTSRAKTQKGKAEHAAKVEEAKKEAQRLQVERGQLAERIATLSTTSLPSLGYFAEALADLDQRVVEIDARIAAYEDGNLEDFSLPPEKKITVRGNTMTVAEARERVQEIERETESVQTSARRRQELEAEIQELEEAYSAEAVAAREEAITDLEAKIAQHQEVAKEVEARQAVLDERKAAAQEELAPTSEDASLIENNFQYQRIIERLEAAKSTEDVEQQRIEQAKLDKLVEDLLGRGFAWQKPPQSVVEAAEQEARVPQAQDDLAQAQTRLEEIGAREALEAELAAQRRAQEATDTETAKLAELKEELEEGFAESDPEQLKVQQAAERREGRSEIMAINAALAKAATQLPVVDGAPKFWSTLEARVEETQERLAARREKVRGELAAQRSSNVLAPAAITAKDVEAALKDDAEFQKIQKELEGLNKASEEAQTAQGQEVERLREERRVLLEEARPNIESKANLYNTAVGVVEALGIEIVNPADADVFDVLDPSTYEFQVPSVPFLIESDAEAQALYEMWQEINLDPENREKRAAFGARVSANQASGKLAGDLGLDRAPLFFIGDDGGVVTPEAYYRENFRARVEEEAQQRLADHDLNPDVVASELTKLNQVAALMHAALVTIQVESRKNHLEGVGGREHTFALEAARQAVQEIVSEENSGFSQDSANTVLKLLDRADERSRVEDGTFLDRAQEALAAFIEVRERAKTVLAPAENEKRNEEFYLDAQGNLKAFASQWDKEVFDFFVSQGFVNKAQVNKLISYGSITYASSFLKAARSAIERRYPTLEAPASARPVSVAVNGKIGKRMQRIIVRQSDTLVNPTTDPDLVAYAKLLDELLVELDQNPENAAGPRQALHVFQRERVVERIRRKTRRSVKGLREAFNSTRLDRIVNRARREARESVEANLPPNLSKAEKEAAFEEEWQKRGTEFTLVKNYLLAQRQKTGFDIAGSRVIRQDITLEAADFIQSQRAGRIAAELRVEEIPESPGTYQGVFSNDPAEMLALISLGFNIPIPEGFDTNTLNPAIRLTNNGEAVAEVLDKNGRWVSDGTTAEESLLTEPVVPRITGSSDVIQQLVDTGLPLLTDRVPSDLLDGFFATHKFPSDFFLYKSEGARGAQDYLNAFVVEASKHAAKDPDLQGSELFVLAAETLHKQGVFEFMLAYDMIADPNQEGVTFAPDAGGRRTVTAGIESFPEMGKDGSPREGEGIHAKYGRKAPTKAAQNRRAKRAAKALGIADADLNKPVAQIGRLSNSAKAINWVFDKVTTADADAEKMTVNEVLIAYTDFLALEMAGVQVRNGKVKDSAARATRFFKPDATGMGRFRIQSPAATLRQASQSFKQRKRRGAAALEPFTDSLQDLSQRQEAQVVSEGQNNASGETEQAGVVPDTAGPEVVGAPEAEAQSPRESLRPTPPLKGVAERGSADRARAKMAKLAAREDFQRVLYSRVADAVNARVPEGEQVNFVDQALTEILDAAGVDTAGLSPANRLRLFAQDFFVGPVKSKAQADAWTTLTEEFLTRSLGETGSSDASTDILGVIQLKAQAADQAEIKAATAAKDAQLALEAAQKGTENSPSILERAEKQAQKAGQEFARAKEQNKAAQRLLEQVEGIVEAFAPIQKALHDIREESFRATKPRLKPKRTSLPPGLDTSEALQTFINEAKRRIGGESADSLADIGVEANTPTDFGSPVLPADFNLPDAVDRGDTILAEDLFEAHFIKDEDNTGDRTTVRISRKGDNGAFSRESQNRVFETEEAARAWAAGYMETLRKAAEVAASETGPGFESVEGQTLQGRLDTETLNDVDRAKIITEINKLQGQVREAEDQLEILLVAEARKQLHEQRQLLPQIPTNPEVEASTGRAETVPLYSRALLEELSLENEPDRVILERELSAARDLRDTYLAGGLSRAKELVASRQRELKELGGKDAADAAYHQALTLSDKATARRAREGDTESVKEEMAKASRTLKAARSTALVAKTLERQIKEAESLLKHSKAASLTPLQRKNRAQKLKNRVFLLEKALENRDGSRFNPATGGHSTTSSVDHLNKLLSDLQKLRDGRKADVIGAVNARFSDVVADAQDIARTRSDLEATETRLASIASKVDAGVMTDAEAGRDSLPLVELRETLRARLRVLEQHPESRTSQEVRDYLRNLEFLSANAARLEEAITRVEQALNHGQRPNTKPQQEHAFDTSNLYPVLGAEADPSDVREQLKDLGLAVGQDIDLEATLKKINAQGGLLGRAAGMLRRRPDLLSDGEVTIKFVSRTSVPWAGAADPDSNTIYINLARTSSEGVASTLVHELTHLATHNLLRNPRTKSDVQTIKRLERLRLAILKQASLDPSSEASQKVMHMLENLDEFVAYVSSDPSAQKALIAVGPHKNFLQRFFAWVTSIFTKNPHRETLEAFAAAQGLIGKGEGYALPISTQANETTGVPEFELRRSGEVDPFGSKASGEKIINLAKNMVPAGLTIKEVADTGAGSGVRVSAIDPSVIEVDAMLLETRHQNTSPRARRAIIRAEILKVAGISLAIHTTPKAELEEIGRAAHAREFARPGMSDQMVGANYLRVRMEQAATGRTTEAVIDLMSDDPGFLKRLAAGILPMLNRLRGKVRGPNDSHIAETVQKLRTSYSALLKAQKSPLLRRAQMKDDAESLARTDRPVFSEAVALADVFGDDFQPKSGFVAFFRRKGRAPAPIRFVLEQADQMRNSHRRFTATFAQGIKDLQKKGVLTEGDLPLLYQALGSNKPTITSEQAASIKADVQEHYEILLESVKAEKGTDKLSDDDLKQIDEALDKHRAELVQNFRLQNIRKVKQDMLEAHKSLPPEVQAWVTRVRKELQDRVEPFLQADGFSGELQTTVDENGEFYLTRSYYGFSTEGWWAALQHGKEFTLPNGRRIDFARIKANAMATFMDQAQKQLVREFQRRAKKEDGVVVTEEEAKVATAERLHDRTQSLFDTFVGKLSNTGGGMLTAWISEQDVADALFDSTESGEGPKKAAVRKSMGEARNNLLRKEDLPDWVREALGEVTDPVEAVIHALDVTSRIGTAAQMQSELLAQGRGNFLWTAKDFKNGIVTEGFRVVTSEDGPLKGYYAPDEIAEVLDETLHRQILTKGEMDNLLRHAQRFTGLSMGAKTLLGLGFYPRNYFGNQLYFGPAQGYFGAVGKTFKFQSEEWKMLRDLVTNRISSPEREARIRRLIELNIIGDDMFSGTFNELISEYDNADKLIEDILDLEASGTPPKKLLAAFELHAKRLGKSKAGKAAKSVPQWGAKLSRMIDGAYKAAYFEHELQVLQQAHGDSVPLEMLEQEAAEKVKQTAQSHSLRMPLAKILTGSTVGVLVAPFLGFRSEVYRISANTIGLSLKEIKSSNARIKRRGIQRLAGFTAVNSVGTAAHGFLLNMLFGVLFPGDEDRKEIATGVFKSTLRQFASPVKTWEQRGALRLMLPHWMQFNDVLYVPTGNGFRTLNLSYTNPFSVVRDAPLALAKAILSGDQNQALEVMEWAFFEEIFGEQILAGSLKDAIMNEDDFGQPISNKQDSFLGAVGKRLFHGLKASYAPSALSPLSKIAQGKGGALADGSPMNAVEVATGELFGARPRVTTTDQGMERAARTLARNIRQAKSAYRDLLTDTREAHSLEELNKFHQQTQEYLNKQVAEAREFNRVMLDLGKETEALNRAMQTARFGKRRIKAILENGESETYLPVIPEDVMAELDEVGHGDTVRTHLDFVRSGPDAYLVD